MNDSGGEGNRGKAALAGERVVGAGASVGGKLGGCPAAERNETLEQRVEVLEEEIRREVSKKSE